MPPLLGSDHEKAVVYLHRHGRSCVGVVVAPRIIATAHQCVDGEASGVALPDATLQVQSASSTSRWTPRHPSLVVTPSCAWDRLDLAFIVLSEPIDAVVPARVGKVPARGAGVHVIGFGRCTAQRDGTGDKVGLVKDVDLDVLTITMNLCQGDVGGPAFSSVDGDLIGIVSHKADAESGSQPAVTAVRLDAPPARALLADAVAFANGADPSRAATVPCE